MTKDIVIFILQPQHKEPLMATSFRTLCLLSSPPVSPQPLPTSSTSKLKKSTSLRKSQLTWVISTNSNKSKIVCMSHQPIRQQFLQANFKKDDDIVRLAPLILKQPILVNFDNILNYQVFGAHQVKSIYQLSLKFQVEQLFSGRSSNLILMGPCSPKILQELASVLCKHVLDILKIQEKNTHKLGISVEWVISNSIEIDLLEEQTVTSFETMNNKPLSIVRLKHPEEIGSILYLSNKNKTKIAKVLERKSKRQSSMVYKLMLMSGQSTFSEIVLYSPNDLKQTNQRQIESLLQYVQGISQNNKEYLYQDSCIIKNLINERTIAPRNVTLIYALINDKKHLQENLITLNLAEAINETIGKKEYIETYSFISTSNNARTRRSGEKREYFETSRDRSGERGKESPYVNGENRRLYFDSNSESKKASITDRKISSQNRTRKDFMYQQLERKVGNLEGKMKEMAIGHKEELERMRTTSLNNQLHYNEEMAVKDKQIQSLLSRLNDQPNNPPHNTSSTRFKGNSASQDKFKEQRLGEEAMKLRQKNTLLEQRCRELQRVLDGKNRVEQKLQSVKKQRDQLKITIKRMNEEIYELIRDQEIDINNLRSQ